MMKISEIQAEVGKLEGLSDSQLNIVLNSVKEWTEGRIVLSAGKPREDKVDMVQLDNKMAEPCLERYYQGMLFGFYNEKYQMEKIEEPFNAGHFLDGMVNAEATFYQGDLLEVCRTQDWGFCNREFPPTSEAEGEVVLEREQIIGYICQNSVVRKSHGDATIGVYEDAEEVLLTITEYAEARFEELTGHTVKAFQIHGIKDLIRAMLEKGRSKEDVIDTIKEGFVTIEEVGYDPETHTMVGEDKEDIDPSPNGEASTQSPNGDPKPASAEVGEVDRLTAVNPLGGRAETPTASPTSEKPSKSVLHAYSDDEIVAEAHRRGMAIVSEGQSSDLPDMSVPRDLDPNSWMNSAKSVLGQHEDHDTEALMEYFRKGGFEWDPRGDEHAWCAAYVRATLAQTGLPVLESLKAADWKEYGEPCEEQYGAIVVGKSHVAFCLGDGKLIGGNQGDMVKEGNIEWYISKPVFRWPVA